ncbi:hypothetical protein SH139x_000921 [Planctomycetaceae bacterium SH139]
MRYCCLLAVGLAMLVIPGCSSPKVEVIDLNRVLDILDQTLVQLDGEKTDSFDLSQFRAPETSKDDWAAENGSPADLYATDPAPTDQADLPDQASGDDSAGDSTAQPAADDLPRTLDAARDEEFLALYRENLNAAQPKLMSHAIGVSMEATGAIVGYADRNDNKTQDAGEERLFTVQIDLERGRLLASDTANHHRDHHYRPMGGFFTAYMLGSMMSRQGSYYSGARAGAKPNFAATPVSPKNYHSNAVSQARAKASSARSSSNSVRSRSGSGGFGFGK